jgi:hypothetical protein
MVGIGWLFQLIDTMIFVQDGENQPSKPDNSGLLFSVDLNGIYDLRA